MLGQPRPPPPRSSTTTHVKDEPPQEGEGDVAGPAKNAAGGIPIPDSIPHAYHAAYVAAATAAGVGGGGGIRPVGAGASPADGVTGAPGGGLAEAVGGTAAGAMETGAMMTGVGRMVAKSPAYAGYHWQDATGRWLYFRQAFFWGIHF